MKTTTPPRRAALRATVAVGVALVLGALAGCSASQPTASATKSAHKTFTIGVADINTTSAFQGRLVNSIQTNAKALGMNTVVLNGNGDSSTEINNINTLVARSVDAMLVISSNPTAVVPAINSASAKGIPVFAINARLDASANIVTYVGDSNVTYGVEEGKLLVKALPKGGKVAVILGPVGGTTEVDRLTGIQSVVKQHPNIQIVATPVDNFDNSQNLAVTQDLLSKYPKGTLNAIVAEGPQMYVGANYALAHGRSDIKFIAGDYTNQVAAAIKSGAIYGTVNQSPDLEGKLGAQYAYDWLTGLKSKVPQPQYLIALPQITKANVAKIPATWSN